MSEVERIQDQLKRAYEGAAWHGPSLREVLAGVTAEQAARKPLAHAHSIWEIVVHISVWERVAEQRIQGKRVEPTAEEDWPPVPDTSEDAWTRALDALEKTHQELRSAIARLDDAQLPLEVVGTSYSIYFLLHGVIQHDLYHAGQIAVLKKAVA
jgi:uncharacterized damage-inducible protein DinB